MPQVDGLSAQAPLPIVAVSSITIHTSHVVDLTMSMSVM